MKIELSAQEAHTAYNALLKYRTELESYTKELQVNSTPTQYTQEKLQLIKEETKKLTAVMHKLS